jgi:hypothetical protein
VRRSGAEASNRSHSHSRNSHGGSHGDNVAGRIGGSTQPFRSGYSFSLAGLVQQKGNPSTGSRSRCDIQKKLGSSIPF